MSFSAKSFCEDYQINYFLPGNKNVGPGFLGIQCPMCQDHSSHGGFNVAKEYYNCHICGNNWMPKVIARLTKTSISQAKEIIKKYSSGETHVQKKKEDHKYAKSIIFPPGSGPLTEKARNYLISRNFDPDKLISEWGILSTGHLGPYKFRILAPVYLRGELISYQCRDITGQSNTPYMGCEIEESVYFLKYTLYGFDKAIIKKKCVVTEGIVDTWRMGPGAVGTFSMNFMPQQVLMLARNFDKIFLLFDAEGPAQEQADKLFYQLTVGYNKDVEILNLDSGDPGELPPEEAESIMKEIGL